MSQGRAAKTLEGGDPVEFSDMRPERRFSLFRQTAPRSLTTLLCRLGQGHIASLFQQL